MDRIIVHPHWDVIWWYFFFFIWKLSWSQISKRWFHDHSPNPSFNLVYIYSRNSYNRGSIKAFIMRVKQMCSRGKKRLVHSYYWMRIPVVFCLYVRVPITGASLLQRSVISFSPHDQSTACKHEPKGSKIRRQIQRLKGRRFPFSASTVKFQSWVRPVGEFLGQVVWEEMEAQCLARGGTPC